MKGAIKQQDERLSRFVRASSSIASLHCAVEEVILNSIDAHSRSIDIVLDVESFSFVVTDDGNGVDTASFENIGEWNRTSKINNTLHSDSGNNESDATYGMKGEALAAIRALSYMEIEGKPKSATALSSLVHRKQFDKDGNVLLWTVDPTISQCNIQERQLCGQQNHHGITVAVYDLFHNLPVRRKVLRSESEISTVKEFVQNMSILHHAISWTLSTACLTATSGSGSGSGSGSYSSRSAGMQRNVLLRLASQASVAKRYIGYHGMQNMLNMQGFLSPPLPHCCLQSREGQHLYLNGRWLRNADKLSTAIDAVYCRLLGALSGSAGGMNARHAAPHNSQVGSHSSSGGSANSGCNSGGAMHQKGGVHPCFVLQVTCSAAEYDILSDPDKSVAVFRNEASALRCVEEVVDRLLQEHWPERYRELVHLAYAESASRMGVSASSSGTAGSKGALWRAQQGSTDQLAGEPSASTSDSEGESDEVPMSVRQLEHYSVVTAPRVSTSHHHSTAAGETTTHSNSDSERLHQQSQSLLGVRRPSPHSLLFASAFFSGPTTPLSAQQKHTAGAVTQPIDQRDPLNGAHEMVGLAGLRGLLSSPYAGSPYSPYIKRAKYDHTRNTRETPEHLRNSAVKRMITAVVGREAPHTNTTASAEYVSVSHSIGGDGRVDEQVSCTSSPHKRARRDDPDAVAGTQVWAENAAITAEVGVNVRRLSFSPDVMQRFPQLDPQHNERAEYADPESYTAAEAEKAYTSEYTVGCGESQLGDEDPTMMSVAADVSLFPWNQYALNSPHKDADNAEATMSGTQGREYMEISQDERQSFRSPAHYQHSDAQWAARSFEAPPQPLRHPHPHAHPLTKTVSRNNVKLGDISADIASECGADALCEGVRGGNAGTAMAVQNVPIVVQQSQQSQQSGWSSAAVSSTDTGQYLQHTLRRSNTDTVDTTAVGERIALQSKPSHTAPIDIGSRLPTATAQPATTELTLSKASLRDHMQCIGQADRKFLIARTCCCSQSAAAAAANDATYHHSLAVNGKWCSQCGNSSLLLVLDQHAVDERVQYETLCQALLTAGRTGRTSAAATGVSGTNTLVLSVRESEVLGSHAELLAAWGFGYTENHTQQPPQATASTTHSTDAAVDTDAAADHASLGGAKGSHICSITVHTVPEILNEPLVAADLREFLQHIAAHRELPDALLSPPAVQRIVASRACHSAVRFGDALDGQRCGALLRQLMLTELPFQCAHGRPSMAPVLDMRELHRHKRRELGWL